MYICDSQTSSFKASPTELSIAETHRNTVISNAQQGLITSIMACVSSMSYSDLTHSQYLWPSAAVELHALAANTSARPEYKAQLQRQYESSQTFQRQFAIYVAQLVHQQQRVTNLFAVSSPSPSIPLSPPSSCPTPTPKCSAYTRGPHAMLSTHCRQTILLVPPRPRLSSVLSPSPPHTPLPGPLRRPMPPHRARATPEVLLRQALLNCAHGRVPFENSRADATEFDEELGHGWVFLRGEDWEMDNTTSNL